MKMLKLNQSGSALMSVIVSALVIGGLSAVIMQQASQSQQYSRLARVKSAMFNAEVQIRSLALEPSSYVGCDGQNPETCKFNNALLSGFQSKVAGAKCDGGGSCGIIVVPGSATFDGTTRRFGARIHYQGQELPLRDVEIQNLVIPQETLMRSAALCPDARPLFKGFQNGVAICDPLNATCPPNQWATKVDVDTLAVTCIPLPASLSCAPGEYLAALTHDDTGIHRTCRPRADVFTYNNFTPNLTQNSVSTSSTQTTLPPSGPRNVYELDNGCALTLTDCEARSGVGNCTASADGVYRAVSGSGGTSYLGRMCDVAWPGDLRGSSCSPIGSTKSIWEECKYDGSGGLNWDYPYMLTNYQCQAKEYCPGPPPPSTTVPTTTTTTPPPPLPPGCYDDLVSCESAEGVGNCSASTSHWRRTSSNVRKGECGDEPWKVGQLCSPVGATSGDLLPCAEPYDPNTMYVVHQLLCSTRYCVSGGTTTSTTTTTLPTRACSVAAKVWSDVYGPACGSTAGVSIPVGDTMTYGLSGSCGGKAGCMIELRCDNPDYVTTEPVGRDCGGSGGGGCTVVRDDCEDASCIPMVPKIDEDGDGETTNCWTYTSSARLSLGEERSFTLSAGGAGHCTNNPGISSCIQKFKCFENGTIPVRTFNGCDSVPTTTLPSSGCMGCEPANAPWGGSYRPAYMSGSAAQCAAAKAAMATPGSYECVFVPAGGPNCNALIKPSDLGEFDARCN